jgi:hypothetical protein
MSSPRFGRAVTLETEYNRWLDAIQQLRGRVYVADGAIPPEVLDAEGRHHDEFDELCWHLLLVGMDSKKVYGGVRHVFHPNGAQPEDLRLYEVVRRMPTALAGAYRRSLSVLMRKASDTGTGFCETGGWVVDEVARGTRQILSLPLSAWAFGQVAGGAYGMCFATDRHVSAGILQRLGGFPLCDGDDPLPPFHDPLYRCPMFALAANLLKPAKRYLPLVLQIADYIRDPQRAPHPDARVLA